MFQKQIIVGRLTRDMEQKDLGESLLTSFSVAVDDGFGDKKTTDFFNVSAWNGVGKGVAPYLTKGTLVLVEGKMKMRKTDSTTYWDLRADRIQLMGNSQSNGQAGASQSANRSNSNNYQSYGYQQTAQNQPQNAFFMQGIGDDDLPF